MAALAAPVALLVLLYAVLLFTPIPLPFVSQQVRNVVLSSLPEGTQLELGDMALALEGFAWPVIQFAPVKYTDTKTGGEVSMDALEVGFSPLRVLVGQAGATITVVGPRLQVNQDLFGPRLAKFEFVDEPDGSRTVRVLEGLDPFPDVSLSPDGLNFTGRVPEATLGIRSDNDWLVYNLEAAGKGIAQIVEQARAGNFSRLVVRDGVLEMNDALYAVFRTFKGITLDIAPTPDNLSATGRFSTEFAGTRMGGDIEWNGAEDGSGRLNMSIANFEPGAFSPMAGDESAVSTILGSMAVSMDIGFNSETSLTDGLFHLDMTGMDFRAGDDLLPIAGEVAEVVWDPALGQFTMAETRLSLGTNAGTFSGVFRLGLDTQFGPTVSIALNGRDIVLASDLGMPDEPFNELSFTGWSAPLYGAVGIDQFRLSKADGAEIAGTGRFDMLRMGSGFDLTIVGDKVSADDVKRVWPPMVASETRDWFVKNVVGGRLKAASMRYNFPVGSLDAQQEGDALPPDSVFIDLVGSDVTITPMEGMDPIVLNGDTRLSVRDADVTISAAGATIPTAKGRVGLANVAFVIGAEGTDDVIYEISGDLSSGLPALVDLAKTHQPDLLKQSEVPVDVSALAGNLSLSLVATVVNDRETGENKRLDYAINGVVQDFGSSEPLQGRTIEGGQLSFVASQAGYRVNGQATIDGLTADVVIDGKLEENAPPPDMLLSATLSSDDLKKMGFDVSEFLTGSVDFVARPLADGTLQVAVDLAKARLTVKDLGIDKARGTAGSAKAAIKLDGDAAEVGQIDVAFGDVKLKGSVKVDLKKGLQSADFSTVALSAGDNARMSLRPTDSGYEVTLRGAQLDLKPMLQRFFSLSGESTGGPQATAVNQTIVLDAELDRALGFYRTTAFNLNLDLTLRGSDLRGVSLQANLGGNRSVSVITNQTPSGRVMTVAFNDLGTLLRLMNIYPNVEGGEGQLVLETVNADKTDRGQFVLRNFAIVNEENVAQILGNHRESQQMISRANKLAFRSGEVDFVRRSDRVEITDAVLAGDTVGGTARGFIYTDRRQYDISGTYVPLFGLNNAFGRLLGPLAGRDGEGLFGVTFQVRGPLDKPDFRVNPMSALVPGAFRRMFEYRSREIPRTE